jgi:hypothetical protein
MKTYLQLIQEEGYSKEQAIEIERFRLGLIMYEDLIHVTIRLDALAKLEKRLDKAYLREWISGRVFEEMKKRAYHET